MQYMKREKWSHPWFKAAVVIVDMVDPKKRYDVVFIAVRGCHSGFLLTVQKFKKKINLKVPKFWKMLENNVFIH